MLPNWVFGLWQSRQRYETADQSLDVVKQFRQRQIPFDNIVQDWQYCAPTHGARTSSIPSVSRSCRLDPVHPRPARPSHDLRLGQVQPKHRQPPRR